MSTDKKSDQRKAPKAKVVVGSSMNIMILQRKDPECSAELSDDAKLSDGAK